MSDNSYINWYTNSDRALSQTIGLFVKHHRLKQQLTQQEVANRATISRSTLSLLERGETVTLTTLLQVLRVLNLLHIMDVFKVNKTLSPIALAKAEKSQRQRARSNRNTSSHSKNESTW